MEVFANRQAIRTDIEGWLYAHYRRQLFGDASAINNETPIFVAICEAVEALDRRVMEIYGAQVASKTHVPRLTVVPNDTPVSS